MWNLSLASGAQDELLGWWLIIKESEFFHHKGKNMKPHNAISYSLTWKEPQAHRQNKNYFTCAVKRKNKSQYQHSTVPFPTLSRDSKHFCCLLVAA